MYPSLSIITMSKSRRMRYAEDAACIEGKRNAYMI
jgi:hypothetical protein